MTDFYSSAQAVIDRTGIQPADLGKADPEALEGFLEDLLEEASDIANRVMGHDYLEDLDDGTISSIPKGLAGIVADVVADHVGQMVVRRQTPVVRIDDYAVRSIESRMLSPDVRRRLRLYGSKGLGSISLTSRSDEESFDA